MLSRLFGTPADDINNLKLEFRQTLSRIYRERISRDERYWKQFFQVFDAPSETASLLPAEVLRAALSRQPENIATLVTLCVERLTDLLASPTFPVQSSAMMPSVSSWMGGNRPTSSAETINSSREFLNAARVLCRVLPVLYEKVGASTQHVSLAEDQAAAAQSSLDWVNDLLWKRHVVQVMPEHDSGDASQQSAAQFVIDDEEEEEGQDQQAPQDEAPEAQTKELPSLGEQLLNTVLDSLFVQGFTLPITKGPKVSLTIWEAGIGSNTSPQGTVKAHLNARSEMLRLLLSMLSCPIYAPNAAVASHQFRDRLAKLPNRKLSLTFMCSMLNTALENKGGNLFEAVSSPYNVYSRLSELALQPKTEDLVDLLPTLCFQLLDILLLPTPPAPAPSTVVSDLHPLSADASRSHPLQASTSSSVNGGSSNAASPGAADGSDNVFRLYLGKLHRASDFEFLWKNISKALQSASSGFTNTVSLIPGLSPTRQSAAECLVLLWRLMDCNKAFLTYILSENRPVQLLVLLLNICLDFKDAPAHFNVIRLCAFILQSLSAEKNFGNKLNAPVTSVPGGAKHAVVADGSAADFLITSVSTLIFSTQSSFNVVYPSFVLCISNCSPLFQRLSPVASTKMLQLFLAFSAPTFILAEEGNPRLVYYLVEAFNYIIHYQLAHNPHLIYAIIQSHRRFENLSTFTLKSAVNDIRRIRSERRNTSSPGSPTSENAPELKSMPSTVSLVSVGTFAGEDKSFDEEDPVRMSEKARGKMRERTDSVDGDHADPGFPGPYRSQSGFVPTESWVASWREHLPLDSILIMLSELRPKVESLCSAPSRSTTQAVLDFLQSVTLAGELPSPPPLRPRRFHQSAFSARWLSAFVWGLVYVTNVAAFFNTRVALFSVAPAPQSSVVNEAAEAFNRVGSAMGTAMMQRMPSEVNRNRRGSVNGAVV